MTGPVHSIGPDATIAAAKRLFLTHSFHHLPVVDGTRVVGMLSSVDVMRACVQALPGTPSPAVSPGSRKVCELMSHVVFEIGPHESMQRAVELMVRHGIHSLPVVDADRALIGIITTTDIMHSCLGAVGEAARSDGNAQPSLLAQERVAAVLASARRAVANHRDPYGIAATLLATQQQVASLQEIAVAARRYLNAGQDDHLHAVLTKTLERWQRLDERIRKSPDVLLPS